MKKCTGLILAILIIFAGTLLVSASPVIDGAEDAALFANVNGNDSELLYYQNFDNLPTGAVANCEIPSMFGLTSVLKNLGTIDYGVISPTPEDVTFEICEEADGNKYLKVTGKIYRAFGVHFLDENGDTETHYAVMDFNYKFPESGKNAGLTRFAFTKVNEAYCDWSASTAFTDNSKTVWTNPTVNNALDSVVTTTPCLGLGFNQSANTYTECVIHIDDFAVWNFVLPRETSHQDDVKKTIHFANSTGVTATSLPKDVTGAAWCNLYGGQHFTHPTRNLNDYAAVAAGYEFKGWSMTDGGLKIKDIDYSQFKIIGDITLYPIWEKITVGAVAKYEGFEDFEIGKELTSADLEFININQFAVADVTAIVIEDEITGSKALQLSSSNRFLGFNIKNRVVSGADGMEYWSYNYRFPTADPGARFILYAGADHTGAYHRQSSLGGADTARNVDWKRMIQSVSTTAATTGCYFGEPDGNYTIIIDDLYYWFVPNDYTDEQKAVEITFANSTTGLVPESVTLPEAMTVSMWEAGSTNVNIDEIVPTDYSGVYSFKGWSRADGGNLLKKSEINNFIAVTDITLYAVWEYAAPESGYEYSIRTGSNAGMRFASTVKASQRVSATEYGYIVARNDVLESLGFTASDLTFDIKHESIDISEGKLFLKGVAYENLDGGEPETDISYGDTDDGATIFSAVCTGVDTSSESEVTTGLVVRPYIVINGTYCYGTPMVKSYYDIALLVKNSEVYNELDEITKEFITSIITIAEQ